MVGFVYIGFRAIYFSTPCLSLLQIYITVRRSRGKRWYEATDLFLLNLALLDFIFGLIGTIKTILKESLKDVHTENVIVFRAMIAFSTFSSVIAIGALTIDMYIAAAYPFKFKLWRSKRNVLFTLLSSWVLIGALAAVPHVKSLDLLSEGKSCARIGVSLTTFIIGTFLGYTYWRIFNILHKSRTQFSGSNSNCTEEVINKKKQAEKHLLYIGALVTCSFVTLTTPYVILNTILCAGYDIPIKYRIFCNMMYIAKSPVYCMIFLVIHFLSKMQEVKKK